MSSADATTRGAPARRHSLWGPRASGVLCSAKCRRASGRESVAKGSGVRRERQSYHPHEDLADCLHRFKVILIRNHRMIFLACRCSSTRYCKAKVSRAAGGIARHARVMRHAARWLSKIAQLPSSSCH